MIHVPFNDSDMRHIIVDDDSHATEEDIAIYRQHGWTASPSDLDRPYIDELVEPPAEKDYSITPDMLQRENRTSGGSGSSGKNRPKEAKRMTPQEIMDLRCRQIRDNASDAYLAETDTQKAERQLKQEQKKLERQERKEGRPRNGEEVAQRYSYRAEPKTMALAKELFGGAREAIEAAVEMRLSNA